MSRQDYRDVTTHEIGHALGLGHSNSSSDLMYPYHDIFASKYAISTLDLYALAVAYQWMNDTQTIPQTNSVALPPNIQYSYAPLTNPAPTTIKDNIIIKGLLFIFEQPYLLALFMGITAMLIVLAVFIKKTRAR